MELIQKLMVDSVSYGTRRNRILNNIEGGAISPTSRLGRHAPKKTRSTNSFKKTYIYAWVSGTDSTRSQFNILNLSVEKVTVRKNLAEYIGVVADSSLDKLLKATFTKSDYKRLVPAYSFKADRDLLYGVRIDSGYTDYIYINNNDPNHSSDILGFMAYDAQQKGIGKIQLQDDLEVIIFPIFDLLKDPEQCLIEINERQQLTTFNNDTLEEIINEIK